MKRLIFFRTVKTQPTGNVWAFENEWNNGICGCCGDLGTCMKEKIDKESIKRFLCFLGCFAYWCFPCFMCKLHSRTNECLCTWCLPGGKLIELEISSIVFVYRKYRIEN
jgi:hypothetical protein